MFIIFTKGCESKGKAKAKREVWQREGVRRPENEAQRLRDRNVDTWRKENPLGDRKGQK